MLFRLFSLIFIFLFIYNFRLFAQTGCYVSTAPATFAPNSIGNAGPAGVQRPTYTGSLALQGTTTCPRVKTFGNTSIGVCYIRTGPSTNYVYTSGNIYNYVPENCPLDDYVWVIVVAIGGIGFVMLRKSIVA